jgi:hypothetical protein
MDNKWNNINKRKETINSDGQQVEQYKEGSVGISLTG